MPAAVVLSCEAIDGRFTVRVWTKEALPRLVCFQMPEHIFRVVEALLAVGLGALVTTLGFVLVVHAVSTKTSVSMIRTTGTGPYVREVAFSGKGFVTVCTLEALRSWGNTSPGIGRNAILGLLRPFPVTWVVWTRRPVVNATIRLVHAIVVECPRL